MVADEAVRSLFLFGFGWKLRDPSGRFQAGR